MTGIGLVLWATYMILSVSLMIRTNWTKLSAYDLTKTLSTIHAYTVVLVPLASFLCGSWLHGKACLVECAGVSLIYFLFDFSYVCCYCLDRVKGIRFWTMAIHHWSSIGACCWFLKAMRASAVASVASPTLLNSPLDTEPNFALVLLICLTETSTPFLNAHGPFHLSTVCVFVCFRCILLPVGVAYLWISTGSLGSLPETAFSLVLCGLNAAWGFKIVQKGRPVHKVLAWMQSETRSKDKDDEEKEGNLQMEHRGNDNSVQGIDTALYVIFATCCVFICATFCMFDLCASH
jgi:hypothetical protein